MRTFLLSAVYISITATFFLPASVLAQRDFLTNEEIELVRDAQEIDRRIEVLIQAIDRRFHVLKLEAGAAKVKKGGDWGELPEGTKAELFLDIRRLLQKAADDIDSLAERPDSAILPEPGTRKKGESTYAVLFPRAVRSLAAAAERYSPVLQLELESGGGSNVVAGSILGALELCKEIIASVAKLPAEVQKKSGKKT